MESLLIMPNDDAVVDCHGGQGTVDDSGSTAVSAGGGLASCPTERSELFKDEVSIPARAGEPTQPAADRFNRYPLHGLGSCCNQTGDFLCRPWFQAHYQRCGDIRISS